MVMRQKGAKVYRSMQGKVVDIDRLRQKNELTPAVGNAKLNARGDELGPGGKIIRSKEDVMKDYYRRPKKTETSDENLVSDQDNSEETEVVKKTSSRTSKKKDPDEILKQDQEDEWVEDENGNFVKKGE